MGADRVEHSVPLRRRPQFDILGGVSTGALLATHALLGTPADDATLEAMYTRFTKDDIYKGRGIISLLSGAESLEDTAPLSAMIAKYVTAETSKRVAAAYDENRMLFVGTTNIDYGQTWVSRCNPTRGTAPRPTRAIFPPGLEAIVAP
jgi:hypothetical protein